MFKEEGKKKAEVFLLFPEMRRKLRVNLEAPHLLTEEETTQVTVVSG